MAPTLPSCALPNLPLGRWDQTDGQPPHPTAGWARREGWYRQRVVPATLRTGPPWAPTNKGSSNPPAPTSKASSPHAAWALLAALHMGKQQQGQLTPRADGHGDEGGVRVDAGGAQVLDRVHRPAAARQQLLLSLPLLPVPATPAAEACIQRTDKAAASARHAPCLPQQSGGLLQRAHFLDHTARKPKVRLEAMAVRKPAGGWDARAGRPLALLSCSQYAWQQQGQRSRVHSANGSVLHRRQPA